MRKPVAHRARTHVAVEIVPSPCVIALVEHPVNDAESYAGTVHLEDALVELYLLCVVALVETDVSWEPYEQLLVLVVGGMGEEVMSHHENCTRA